MILALTADADGDRARCLAAGMDECVAKPLGAQELAAAVGRWFGPELLKSPA